MDEYRQALVDEILAEVDRIVNHYRSWADGGEVVPAAHQRIRVLVGKLKGEEQGAVDQREIVSSAS